MPVFKKESPFKGEKEAALARLNPEQLPASTGAGAADREDFAARPAGKPIRSLDRRPRFQHPKGTTMSMHNTPLTDLEREGLEKHGLPIGTPSQLSDSFRAGIAWAVANMQERGTQQSLSEEHARLCEAIKAEDGFCVDNFDYMLDSDDCIAIIKGEWVRPIPFDANAASTNGGE